MTPFLVIIDDLSYFSYHNATYDASVKFVADLCWNWSYSKWQPPEFISQRIDLRWMTESSPTKWIVPADISVTPWRLRRYNNDVFFLNNAKGLLLYTAPFSAGLFALLWWVRRRCSRSSVVASILRPFGSWGCLAAMLLCDNTNYLSFRCFEQFHSFVPQRSQDSGSALPYLNLIAMLLVLFAVVFCAVVLYILAEE